jgi:hypothetical protein
MVLWAAAPGQTQAMLGHGGRPETSEGPHVSDGHHPGGAGGHHDDDRDRNHTFGGGRGIYWRYPYYFYSYPYYDSAQVYWYYCPSYGAYYPYVSSCPEAWLPVPAS